MVTNKASNDKIGCAVWTKWQKNRHVASLTRILTLGGGRYFSLPSRAFDAIDEHFLVVLVHSLIHTGGKEGRANHFTGKYERAMPRVGTGGGPIYERSIHDLEWLGENYNKIIKACTGLEPKAGPARGQ